MLDEPLPSHIFKVFNPVFDNLSENRLEIVKALTI